jgi:copper chaperone CopZ
MKYFITSIAAAVALSLSAQAADVSTKITDTHVCCQSCVKAVAKVVKDIPGLTAKADQDDESISLTGPDTATVQKATDALVAAGFYGKSSNPDIKIVSDTGAKGEKVKSLTIENVHLCCGKCVKSVNTALESVSGVTGNTAAKGATSFTVTGDFNDQDVFAALQKAGLTGKVGKE